jgi:hypothetical protein
VERREDVDEDFLAGAFLAEEEDFLAEDEDRLAED